MLDLDRGVTKRRHPRGHVVCMYKTEPGRFVDINGQTLSDEEARSAGFDVDRLATERRKQEKMAAARADIEREFEAQSDEMSRILDAQANAYEVRHVGGGKWGIFDDQGNRLTVTPMTKDEAHQMAQRLELPRAGQDAGGDAEALAGDQGDATPAAGEE